jgi:hypothetical protein
MGIRLISTRELSSVGVIRMAWRFLTPSVLDINSPLVTVSYSVPSGLLYLLSGALGELCEIENWESFGDSTDIESSMAFIAVVDSRIDS